MKRLLQIMALLLCTALYSCSSCKNDSDNLGNSISANTSSVTINSDGTTSTGALYTPIDDTMFFLDYIKYQIVDSHLEIVGHDRLEISEHVKPYATVTYKGVTYQTRVLTKHAFSACEKMKSCEIPVTVLRINGMYFTDNPRGARIKGVFSDCTNLQSISLPNSLEETGVETFRDCTSLTSVTFPETLKEISMYSFRGCTGLTSLSFPDGLEEISMGAFYDCSGLATLSFPDNLNRIGMSAFQNCTGLTSVTLPESLDSIESDVFNGCSGLISITFPKGLKSIESQAFNGCSGLTSITLPKYLNSIEFNAFSGCSGLKSITCLAVTPPLVSYWIFDDEIYENASLYVPVSSIDAYKETSGWGRFKNIQGL